VKVILEPMNKLAMLVFAAAVVFAEPVRVHQSGFTPGAEGAPDGWKLWAPRVEIAPRGFVDTVRNRGESGSLALAGNSNTAVFGAWVRTVAGIQPGKWYRLVAHYRAESLHYEPLDVLARLDWRTSESKRAGQPDYAAAISQDDGWNRVTVEAPAPDRVVSVELQLYLANAPQGTVYWDDITFEEIPAPPPRRITVASVNFRPSGAASAAENVRRFLEVVEKTVPRNADLILLPEGITVVGTNKSYAETAEPVPGPTTEMLAEAARKRNAYIVAGIYERDGIAMYNTAVLIDRTGRLAGKYRKVYLPREELEGGLTPGIEYPVFQTDFGRVGMMICWDVQYSDPARALALRGAEVLLLPIWGGNETLAKARAIENQVFLVASGYDYPTHIIDPNGEIIARAPEQGAAAVATIDLNRRYVDEWLGHMRTRMVKEMRLDVGVERGMRYNTTFTTP